LIGLEETFILFTNYILRHFLASFKCKWAFADSYPLFAFSFKAESGCHVSSISLVVFFSKLVFSHLFSGLEARTLYNNCHFIAHGYLEN